MMSLLGRLLQWFKAPVGWRVTVLFNDGFGLPNCRIKYRDDDFVELLIPPAWLTAPSWWCTYGVKSMLVEIEDVVRYEQNVMLLDMPMPSSIDPLQHNILIPIAD